MLVYRSFGVPWKVVDRRLKTVESTTPIFAEDVELCTQRGDSPEVLARAGGHNDVAEMLSTFHVWGKVMATYGIFSSWLTRWWFQIFFVFHPYFHFDWYFSNGLKPPTRAGWLRHYEPLQRIGPATKTQLDLPKTPPGDQSVACVSALPLFLFGSRVFSTKIRWMGFLPAEKNTYERKTFTVTILSGSFWKNQLLGPKSAGDLRSCENCLWPSSLENPWKTPKNPWHLQECETIRDGQKSQVVLLERKSSFFLRAKMPEFMRLIFV